MSARRGLALGLRPRFVGALILTSAITLAVAALALLPPLEERFRRSEVDALVEAGASARPALVELPQRVQRPGSPVLVRLAERIHRRANASVTILDDRGRILASADAARGDPYADARRAIATRRVQRATGEPGSEATLAVAVPARTDRRWRVVALRRSAADAGTATAVVRGAGALAALAGLLSAGLVGTGLASHLLRRLRRLREAAAMVATAGPAAELVADEGRDEVGDLGRALAAMQRQLQRQEAARRRFVSTASHELRTPLASLSVTLELAEAELEPVGGVNPLERLGQARAEVALARAQAGRLTRLASDLLDLSRLDADVPLRSEAVDVGEVCRAVVAELPRGPAVALDVPAARCWAIGDPGSVARVLRILLDNAARAAGPGGEVAVRLSADGGDGVAIAVRDDGPGVAEEDRARIFHRFARGRGAPDGGFGLGLAIAGELARRMDGELGLAPEPPPGACFTLRLRAAGPSGTSTGDSA